MNEHHLLAGNQLVRRKQINTLHIFNENVVEVSHDVEYRITFQAQDHLRLIMIIYLPPEFPGRARPIIRIFPVQTEDLNANLSHPWLNTENIVIGSPGLNSFGHHSDLGRVVQAIRREFERKPPIVQKNINSTHSTTITPPLSSSSSTGAVESRMKSSINRSIPEIEQLSKDELERLQSNPLAFSAFCRKLNISMFASMEEKSAQLKRDVDSMMTTNVSLTAELRAKQSTLEEKREALQEAKDAAAATASQLNKGAERLSKSVLCDNLLKASQADETESERCAEQFLQGDLKLEDFLNQYVSVRCQHHGRKTKYDKLMRNQ